MLSLRNIATSGN